MRNAKLSALSLATILAATAVPVAASAGNPAWPNWYLGLHGGIAMLSDADVDGTPSGKTEYDNGYMFSASLGYSPAFTLTSLGKGRIEAEYYIQKNDFDRASLGGVSGDIGGDQETQALMLNAYYDFALQNSRFAPYIGGGIGFANTDVSSSFSGVSLVDDDDGAFAWQLMAGLGYSPESIPFTTFSVGYRYFTTQDVKLTTAAGTGIKLENDSNNIEVGAQFKF